MKKDYTQITPWFVEAALNLLADPTFNPRPLFPMAEDHESLFDLTKMNEDGSCTVHYVRCRSTGLKDLAFGPTYLTDYSGVEVKWKHP